MKELFQISDHSFAPIYSWVWNAPVSKEETDAQLAEFERLGIRAFYIIPEPKTFRPTIIPTLMEPDYLTKDYFEAYRYAMERAFELGMTAWLYDEGGWPSGGACGKVLLEHPELARQVLKDRQVTVAAGTPYVMAEGTLSAFLPDGRVVAEGEIFKEDTVIEEYYTYRMFFDVPGIPDFPDLTRRESADAFIELTHNGYKKYLKEYFGDKITAVFTDEPEAPRPLPFRKELEEMYEKRYGASIRPYLAVMLKSRWGKAEHISPDAAEAMIRWYDLCSSEFCKNFLLVEKQWSNDNGMAFTGHLNGDDIPMGSIRSASYHVMRCLRCFDIPAVDVIWRQIFPAEPKAVGGEKTCENRFFPRYASSAAAQVGGNRAASESFGVYGNGLTYEQMRYVIGFQSIRGINIINPMLIPYGRRGFQLAGELPAFCESYACFGDLKHFNNYVERLCYLSSLGERKVSIALYMPMNDFWSGVNVEEISQVYEKAGFELEESNLYFDIFDDDVIASCGDTELKNGAIVMGKARYTQLVIPPCSFMPEATKKKLEQFISAGGTVYAVENAGNIAGAIPVKDCRNIIKPEITFCGNAGSLRTYTRVLENGKMTFVFNQSFKKENVTIEAEKNTVLIDITMGKCRKLEEKDGKVRFTLQSGETVGILQTDTICDIPMEEIGEKQEISGDYLFRRTKQFRIGEMTADTKELQEQEKPILLGDWRSVVGEDFSGSGVYKTIFIKPAKMGNTVTLDLGTVYHSCEVFLNGESLGVLVMSPYRLEIPAERIKQENTLEIRVSNSVANEFQYTKALDRWATWQLTRYFVLEKEFDKDSLCGGLIGPIVLYS